MGGSAKFRFVKRFIERKRKEYENEIFEFDEDYARQQAKEAYEQYLREKNNPVNTELPKLLKNFTGHIEKSKNLRDNSPVDAQKLIDRGEEYLRKAVEKLEFRRRIKESTVAKILSSGRIMNQFETGTSMGAEDLDARDYFSRTAFEYDGDLTPADYEKYGYLGSPDSVSAASYGNLDIVFKKDTMVSRTTMTLGDSLYDVLYPSWVSNPRIISKYSAEWGEPDRITEGEARYFYEQAKQLYDTGSYGYQYAELQFHGDVTLNDIDHFSVPKTWKNNPSHAATIQQIESAGFKVTYDNSK